MANKVPTPDDMPADVRFRVRGAVDGETVSGQGYMDAESPVPVSPESINGVSYVLDTHDSELTPIDGRRYPILHGGEGCRFTLYGETLNGWVYVDEKGRSWLIEIGEIEWGSYFGANAFSTRASAPLFRDEATITLTKRDYSTREEVASATFTVSGGGAGKSDSTYITFRPEGSVSYNTRHGERGPLEFAHVWHRADITDVSRNGRYAIIALGEVFFTGFIRIDAETLGHQFEQHRVWAVNTSTNDAGRDPDLVWYGFIDDAKGMSVESMRGPDNYSAAGTIDFEIKLPVSALLSADGNIEPVVLRYKMESTWSRSFSGNEVAGQIADQHSMDSITGSYSAHWSAALEGFMRLEIGNEAVQSSPFTLQASDNGSASVDINYVDGGVLSTFGNVEKRTDGTESGDRVDYQDLNYSQDVSADAAGMEGGATLSGARSTNGSGSRLRYGSLRPEVEGGRLQELRASPAARTPAYYFSLDELFLSIQCPAGRAESNLDLMFNTDWYSSWGGGRTGGLPGSWPVYISRLNRLYGTFFGQVFDFDVKEHPGARVIPAERRAEDGAVYGPKESWISDVVPYVETYTPAVLKLRQAEGGTPVSPPALRRDPPIDEDTPLLYIGWVSFQEAHPDYKGEPE